MIRALLPLHIRCRISFQTQSLGFASLAPPKQFSHSLATMEPKFSAGADTSKLIEETNALLEAGWTLNKEQMGIEKTYYFKTYTKALDLLLNIGIRSKSKNHHPEMIIKTGSLYVLWTTHHPRGLSSKDTFMARYCDEHARLIGDTEKSQAQKCGPAPSAQM